MSANHRTRRAGPGSDFPSGPLRDDREQRARARQAAKALFAPNPRRSLRRHHRPIRPPRSRATRKPRRHRPPVRQSNAPPPRSRRRQPCLRRFQRRTSPAVVRYLDYATGRLPTLNMFEYITHKRVQFSYEQEIRAVAYALLMDELGGAELRTHLFTKDGDPSFKIYAPPINPADLIRGIVLHPQATPGFAAEITGLCARHSLPAPVRSEMTRAPVF
jgi:hypothetical protein